VLEKLESWVSEERKCISNPEEEKPTNLEYLQQRQHLEASSSDTKMILCRRLARANDRRREQFRYWAAHPYQPKNHGPEMIQQSHVGRSVLPSTSDGRAVQTTIQRDGGEFRSLKAPSTARTYSTVAKSAIFETAPSIEEVEMERTTYARTVFNEKGSRRVPEAPTVAKSAAEFECPYCHMMLESAAMNNRLRWK
jgi:hypothetical protein